MRFMMYCLLQQAEAGFPHTGHFYGSHSFQWRGNAGTNPV